MTVEEEVTAAWRLGVPAHSGVNEWAFGEGGETFTKEGSDLTL